MENEGASTAELAIELGAFAESAETAARELIAWSLRCEIAPSTRARIGSAVAEAVTNAVEAGAQTLRVEALLTRTDMRVVVADDGPGFDTTAAQLQRATGATSGIDRMHSLAEAVSLHSSVDEGTQVELNFRVTTTEFEEGSSIDLSDLDFFIPETSKELLATLAEDADAPIILSPALAVVVGRLLMGSRPSDILDGALRS